MNTLSQSSLKVPYDLRPAKQVERRMLVDAFLHLTQAGFPIREYQYTGFGSLYFVDFVLFHKLLGVRKMLTVEHDKTLENRVRFNRPYDCIDIVINSATEVIPTLSRDFRHILWLDYDFPVCRDALTDIGLSVRLLPCGSILIITFDVEPPAKDSDEPQATQKYFEDEAGDLLGVRTIMDFIKSNIPKTSVKIIQNAIIDGMAGRRGVSFSPLFHFLYADTHKMVTVGGMICNETEKHQLKRIDMDSAFYLRTNLSLDPYKIIVPPFTRKERHIIDSAMPCALGWQPTEFSLPEETISVYREIYRFLPSYAELLF